MSKTSEEIAQRDLKIDTLKKENFQLKYALSANMPRVVGILNNLFGKDEKIDVYINANKKEMDELKRKVSDAGIYISVLLKDYRPKEYKVAKKWLKENCPEQIDARGRKKSKHT